MTSNNSYSLHKRRYAQISIKVLNLDDIEKKGSSLIGSFLREKPILSRKKTPYKSLYRSPYSKKIQINGIFFQ